MDLDKIMNPFHDGPGFDASFLRMIRPAQRKPRRERLNLEEDTSDEDIFADRRPRKRLTKRKKMVWCVCV